MLSCSCLVTALQMSKRLLDDEAKHQTVYGQMKILMLVEALRLLVACLRLNQSIETVDGAQAETL